MAFVFDNIEEFSNLLSFNSESQMILSFLF